MNLSSSITFADYEVISQWWARQSWPVIPLHMLPSTGLIIKSPDNKSLAAGWLYRTDSAMAVLEWVVGNPDCDKLERGQALEQLITELVAIAKESGVKAIFTSCKHPGLIERYEQAGFKATDKEMTNLIWA